MRRLVCNVVLDTAARGGADGESRIAVLPTESCFADRVMDPHGRCFFQFTHEVRQAVRRLPVNQKMNVVSHATDALGKTTECFHRSAKVFMQARDPGFDDPWFAPFCAEYEVVIQAEVGRRYEAPAAGIPSGCDSSISFDRFPGYRCAQPPANLRGYRCDQ